MAQYGDQVQRREVLETDEHGNPVRITQEKLVQSATGGQYEREVRHMTGTGGTMGDYGSAGHQQGLGQATTGTGTGTYGTTGHQGLGTNTGHGTVGTGPDYRSGDRSTSQTGHHGLGTERGATIGGQGLGEVNRGTGSGTYGTTGQHQGLGENVDHATWGTGTDYPTGGRSVGQTGHQGLGTEPGSGGTTGLYQTRHDPTPMGGAGIGTGTGAGYGGTGTRDTREKKGVMEKIKEKLPGHH